MGTTFKVKNKLYNPNPKKLYKIPYPNFIPPSHQAKEK